MVVVAGSEGRGISTGFVDFLKLTQFGALLKKKDTKFKKGKMIQASTGAGTS